MIIRLSIIVVFFFPLLVTAQAFQIDKPALPIDSLKKVLPLLHDSARVDCLNEIARSYIEDMKLSSNDSALVILGRAYTAASAIKYIKGLGDACLQYGLIYSWQISNSIKREKYYREAISWHQKNQYDNGLGFGLLGLGKVLLNQGSIDEAMKTFEQSAHHFRRAGNEIMLAELIDCFGRVYSAKGDFEKYFEYIKKGLREKKRIHDSRGIIWSFYYLAHTYRGFEDYETALHYFHQSLEQARRQSIPWHPYRSMGNMFLTMGNHDSALYYFREMLKVNPADGPAKAGLGKLFLSRKEYDKALDYMQDALATFKKNFEPDLEIAVLADIGKTYAGKKQDKKALDYTGQCLTRARQTNNKPVLQNVYEIYWKLYEDLQQKDSAYFYFQKFVTLKDSLEDAKFKLQHLQKLALYKVETREEQQQARIDLLNKDNLIKQEQLQKEALMKKVLAGILITLVLLSFIIVRNIGLKRKNEKHHRELVENDLKIQKLDSERTKAELQQQKTELEMQALRAQMNPHFIFNSLNSINLFIFKNQRTEATEYLTKFSRLIRMILHSAVSATVSLSEEIAALQLYMELESLRFEQKFNFKIECEPGLDIEFIRVPPMLLQPYVENAIWHGLMLKKDKGNLWVNICQEGSLLMCTITDNGIGRKKASEINGESPNEHKSMGMRITADRVTLLRQLKQVETSIQVTDLVCRDGSPGGTEVVIKIPLEYD